MHIHVKCVQKVLGNDHTEQQFHGHVKFYLTDLAIWPLVMQIILFQVHRTFHLVFITWFVSKCVVKISKCHYWWWDETSQLCWNQTTVITLEESCFASPQESMTGALAIETVLLGVYVLTCASWIIETLCIMNSLLKFRQSICLSGSSEISVGCGRKEAPWNVDCGTGYSDMIMRVLAALSIRLLLAKHLIATLPQPPIHLTSPLPTFCYSLNLKLPLMEENFRQWKTS
jgi:hypothetical protein